MMKNAMKKGLSLFLVLWMMLSSACAAEMVTGKAQIPEISNVFQMKVPDNEAMRFVQQMKIGWNLGNTFDATFWTGYNQNELAIEKGWCGVYTTKEMIEAVHDAGFNTIRIPVSWHDHMDKETFAVSKPWLDRVQEVVDWAMELDMYVILNSHHDMVKGYCYPTEAEYANSEKFMKTLWSTLAERFRDYDEHLIFESMNEPRLVGTQYEWTYNKIMPDCIEAGDCINRLNQVFVDTVRACGGNNATRYLMVPGYAASPDNVMGEWFKIPEDEADNKIIISVHAYTPYNFALAAGGRTTFDHTLYSDYVDIPTFLNRLYKRYIQAGIPVVVGEFGARDKGGNLQDRVNFAAYYTAACSARGMVCCWWDNNGFKGNGELFGILDRKNMTWPTGDIVLAIMKYAGYENIPAAE
ncbi:MAG: glycoside hydrolase family 5 protein [Clostridia bacterium]|nr:glycoside hydrolase family 5 protein [Clostridia bacterium]